MAEAEQERGLKPRVLFVEDEREWREKYARWFAEWHFPFDAADSYHAAEKKLEAGVYSHAIVDWLGGDGLRVVKKAIERGVPPENIFIHTANWVEDVEAKLHQAGVEIRVIPKFQGYPEFKRIFSRQ